MVTINIHKKDLFLLSAIMIFLIAVGYVVAYNSGQPANIMGHSAGELEGVCLSDGTNCRSNTFVSSWQPISIGGSVTFNHGLGTDELRTTLQFKPTLAGAISQAHSSDYNGYGYGVGIYEISSTQIKVSGGNADLRYWRSNGAVPGGQSSGYVRVIATAV